MLVLKHANVLALTVIKGALQWQSVGGWAFISLTLCEPALFWSVSHSPLAHSPPRFIHWNMQLARGMRVCRNEEEGVGCGWDW